MQIRSIVSLQWKGFVRHPLFEQTIILRLLTAGLYLFAFFFCLFFWGMFFVDRVALLFPEETEPLFIFSLTLLPLLIFDFVLKFIFKKLNHLFYSCLLRFPNSKKSIFIYTIINEVFNFWNWYLLIFFYFYLANNIYPDYGLFVTTTLFMLLWLAQIQISLIVNTIKSRHKESVFVYHTSLNLKPTGSISNYLLLSVRMLMRSPLFKRSLFIYLIFGGLCVYMIQKEGFMSNFFMQILYISVFLNYLPMQLTTFLFSAEAAFFDHLMISPDFRKILTAKYILCLLFAFFSFCILWLVHPLRWESLIHLVAIFVYSMGFTVLSFCSILFIDRKIDLFGSYRQMTANGQSVQSFVIAIIQFILIAIVILIYYLFSLHSAIYFMLISGVLCIVFHQPWFNYLYRCFRAIKYEKMEIFRIQ